MCNEKYLDEDLLFKFNSTHQNNVEKSCPFNYTNDIPGCMHVSYIHMSIYSHKQEHIHLPTKMSAIHHTMHNMHSCKYYINVHAAGIGTAVCACMCAHVRVCMCTCMCACVHV